MLPPNLLAKYLKRFDELIDEGEYISQTIEIVPSKEYPRYNTYKNPEFQLLAKWKINSISLLEQLLPPQSIHKELINGIKEIKDGGKRDLQICIYQLKAIKEDYEQGFLGNLMLQVESEIAADYMGQAEQLLKEGQTGKYDHVPAAVLSGAVLEKALRTLCEKQSPPVPTVNGDGKPLTLNPLIDALKKAGVFNETLAKQLRAWADIRNDAAHGNFDKFDSLAVKLMIQGINHFLAIHMS